MKKSLNVQPYLDFWKNPRLVISELLAKRSFWGIFIIAYLGSFGTNLLKDNGIVTKELKESGEVVTVVSHLSSWGSILSSLWLTIVSLLIGSAILAVLYLLIGKIFSGKGTFMDLYKGSMITALPGIIVLPFALIWIIGSPHSFFDTNLTSGFWSFWQFIVYITSIVSAIYVFIMTIVMISEVHKFSKWKAFFTMILPSVLVAVFLAFALGILLAFVR